MKILMACGLTGGHITNAVNLAVYIKSKSDKIYLAFTLPLGSKFSHLIRDNDFKCYLMPLGSKPSRFGLKYIYFFIKFLQSFLKSVIILKQLKPEIIIGFGSYASIPVILANSLRFKKAKVILHEQNVSAGKANIFLSGLASKVAVSFKETKESFGLKGVFTGNPLKLDLSKINREMGIEHLSLEKGKFNILVAGGSQGSAFINKILIKVIAGIEPELKESLQLIHLAGGKDYNFLKKEYQRINFKRVKLFDFLKDIEYALAVSDLVISRAGAATLAEVTFFGKPAILIPYPYAGGHQQINADYLERHKAALVFKQDNLNFEDFKDKFKELILNKDRLKNMAKASGKLGVLNASDRFYTLINEGLK